MSNTISLPVLDTSVPSPGKLPDLLEQILNQHITHRFFDVAITQRFSRKTYLNFRVKDEFVPQLSSLKNLLAGVVDAAVSVASQPTLGDCSVAECELHFFPVEVACNLAVRVEINSVDITCASYTCEIFSQDRRRRELLVESHGTLCASHSATFTNNVTTLNKV